MVASATDSGSTGTLISTFSPITVGLYQLTPPATAGGQIVI